MNMTVQSKGPLEETGELYHLYKQYVGDMASDRGESLPVKDYSEFANWWEQLTTKVREDCAARFRKTYEGVLREERDAVAQVISDLQNSQ